MLARLRKISIKQYVIKGYFTTIIQTSESDYYMASIQRKLYISSIISVKYDGSILQLMKTKEFSLNFVFKSAVQKQDAN